MKKFSDLAIGDYFEFKSSTYKKMLCDEAIVLTEDDRNGMWVGFSFDTEIKEIENPEQS